MGKQHHGIWHTVREYVTHWSVAGAIVAATGAAPEHWFADLFHEANLPHEALPQWLEHVDYRLVVVVVGLSIIVGDNLWRHRGRNPPISSEIASPSSQVAIQKALPLPDRPSIAVLPFANLSGDAEQEYFSDGVADDILTELSRDRALFVIARNSSFTYRGHSVDVKQVGRELGVRYIVEGSVRREASRVRVTAQLIDALDGSHVWAERYDRALEHVFDVQEEIAEAVVNAVRPAVRSAEQRRVLRKPPGSLTAWEAYQRGLWHLSKGTAHENAQARSWFGQAADIDPGFASPFVGLALTHILDAAYGTRSYAEAGPVALTEARKGVAIDANDPEAQAALSTALAFIGNLDAGGECADRALGLNRNSAAAHETKGGILVYSGRPEEGRNEALVALRLNPRDPHSSMAASLIVASHYFQRDYAAAAETARQYLATYSVHPAIWRYLIASLGQLGLKMEVASALRDWRAAAPSQFSTMTGPRPRQPFMRAEDHEHMLEGLRKAGLVV
jgi:adenylate cyclase